MEPKTQAEVIRRLRCAEGQVHGVIHMVEENRPSVTVIQQIRAIKGALRQIGALLVAQHLDAHLHAAWGNGREDDYRRLRDELLALLAQRE